MDGAIISYDRMIKEISNADIVFVGEVHDEQAHHDLELRIIRSFHESDLPLSVGLAMFRSDSQQDLNSWVSGSSSLEQFLPSYYDSNWRQPWPAYRGIFLYAREHQIPLVGLNIPSDITKAVARNGFTASHKRSRSRNCLRGSAAISTRRTCNLSDRLTRATCIRKTSGSNFCEAQMVWDKSMAWNLIEYQKQSPGKTRSCFPALAMPGSGAFRAGGREVILHIQSVLPLIPGQIERKTVSLLDADYVVLQ